MSERAFPQVVLVLSERAAKLLRQTIDNELLHGDDDKARDDAAVLGQIGEEIASQLSTPVERIVLGPVNPAKQIADKMARAGRKAVTEAITHADGSVTIQAADPNPPSPGPTAPKRRRTAAQEVPCERCGKPSGIRPGTLKANQATRVVCAECATKYAPVDP